MKSEWISVKDKLPHDEELYLVYSNFYNQKYKVLKYHPGLKRFWYGGEHPESITHWMPLPEPPNGR